MTSSTFLWRSLVAACALLVGAVVVAAPQRPPVMLDGHFEDWIDVPVAVEDPADAPDAVLDIRRLQIQADDDWLYLAVDVTNEVTIQSLPGTIRVVIDADADTSTGASLLNMPGVDLAVDYSFMPSPASARGIGAAIWAVRDTGELVGPFNPHALGLTTAPVHASRRFEIRIARSGSERGLPRIGPNVRVKLAYFERGVVVDETVEARFSVAESSAVAGREAVDHPLDWIRRPPGTLRIAHLNVSDHSFRSNAQGFARLLAVVEADVLTLTELPGDSTDDEVRAFFDRAPIDALGPWRFALGVAGGRQRAVVAARGLPLQVATPLADVRYETQGLDRLRTLVSADMQPAIDLERTRGISSVGAWIETSAGRILVVALDLQSGGWLGSDHDRLRLLQARTIGARIDAALQSGPAPVIVGGDFNLVGSREPLTLLAGRSGVGGEELVPVEARRLGERTLATWRNPAQAFTPGRLDYVLVPPEAVDVVRSFVLATDDLDAGTLEALGIDAGLSASVSDHLVVVADLRLP